MAEICCGVVNSDGDTPGGCETTSSRAARRRRMEIRRFRFVAGVSTTATITTTDTTITESSSDGGGGCGVEPKRQRMEISTATSSAFPRECRNAVENSVEVDNTLTDVSEVDVNDVNVNVKDMSLTASGDLDMETSTGGGDLLKFGIASVCGRRRDMEDAVAVHPSLFRRDNVDSSELHYFGVYDGHGCSHVATKCKERLHEIVKEELGSEDSAAAVAKTTEVPEWKAAMEKSFSRMDKEVVTRNEGVVGNCRCELQTPECDAVGSTAVVAVVSPDKIIVANCGDSRAVLCRNGKAVPLSSDHKPDRPDELNRIQEAGGRVIYWDGPRVLGVLAMSRAIGDNYLKPYVSCEPEVTITDRTSDDDCLILASDGLWDVVSNDTACGVARMCLRGKVPAAAAAASPEVEGIANGGEEKADKACSDASMLLTKLALARHSADNVSVVVIDLRKDT